MKTKDPDKVPLFGRKLRALRLARNLTQEELAVETGMTRQMFSYLESRALNPTADVIRCFADHFSISTDELMYEESDGRRHQGPKSKLEEQFEQLRRLPQSRQKTVIAMLDGLLASEASGIVL